MDTNDKLDRLEGKFDRMLLLMENMDKRLDKLEQKVDRLEQGQNEMKQNLATVMEAINIVQHNEQEHFKILNNKDSELENVAKQNSYDIAELRLKTAQ